jgi:hypothetical protein
VKEMRFLWKRPCCLGAATFAMLLAASPPARNATAAGSSPFVWRSLNSPPDVSIVAVNPKDPAQLYAATVSPPCNHTTVTLYASSDYGTTWTPRGSPFSSDEPGLDRLSPAPSNWSTLYAAGLFHCFISSRYFVEKSIDGGAAWTPLEAGYVQIDDAGGLAVDPTDENRIYILALGTVYRSVDGGTSFLSVLIDPPSDLPGYGNALGSVAVDPCSTETIYAGWSHLWKSNDGGETWALTSLAVPSYSIAHITIDPLNSSNVYVATNGDGLWGSRDGGETFVSLNGGIPEASSREVVVSPGRISRLFLLTSGPVYENDDGGIHWQRADAGLPSGTTDLAAARDGSRIYAATPAGVYVLNLGALALPADQRPAVRVDRR